MKAENSPQYIDPAVIARGGLDVPVVTFAGEQSTALVRLLPLNESITTFLALLTDCHGLADFMTGNEAGWARTNLQPASVLDIAEKAIDLNFVLACKWADLQAKFTKLANELKGPPPPSENPPAPGLANL